MVDVKEEITKGVNKNKLTKSQSNISSGLHIMEEKSKPLIIKERSKVRIVVVNSKPTPVKKSSTICTIETCSQKKNGKFDECKVHFIEKHRKGDRFKWSPCISGYETIINILKCYPEVYCTDAIKIKHIQNGAHSKVPLSCPLCEYEWEPVIHDLIGRGSGCPDCAGNIPWTLERFQKRMSERTKINIASVTEDHIKGSESHVPVSCMECGYEWKPRINDLINSKSGCPDCAGNVSWTLERFQDRMTSRVEIDISKVTKKHIKGCESHVPISCVECGYEWRPRINGLINGKTGCPDCKGKAKWTLERFQDRMSDRTTIDISKVEEKHINGKESYVAVSCKECNHEWKASVGSLINGGTGCRKCFGTLPWTLKLFQERMSSRKEISISEVTEKHINNGKSRIPISCVECGYHWKTVIGWLVSGNGCPECAGHIPWTIERFQKKMSSRQEIDISNVTEEQINGEHSHISVSCIKCKHEWSPSINNLIRGSGCPKCKSSKGVKAITTYLNNLKVEYKEEKKFEGLVYKGKLRIDVYVPHFTGIKYPICIEYDGNYAGSHFSYDNEVEKENFLLTVKRDKIKDSFCLKNKMHIIRIPYTCFPKNSEQIMHNNLDIILEELKSKKKPFLYLLDEDLYKKRDSKLITD